MARQNTLPTLHTFRFRKIGDYFGVKIGHSWVLTNDAGVETFYYAAERTGLKPALLPHGSDGWKIECRPLPDILLDTLPRIIRL